MIMTLNFNYNKILALIATVFYPQIALTDIFNTPYTLLLYSFILYTTQKLKISDVILQFVSKIRTYFFFYM